MNPRTYLTTLLVMTFALTACISEPAESPEVTDEAETSAEVETVAQDSRPALNRAAPQRVAPPAPVAQPIVISSGTAMEIMLIDPISTDTNRAGDEFLASLASPISVNGSTVVEEGVRVRGRIVDVREPGRVNGRARIEMVLFEIVGQGVNVPISTSVFVEEADADLARDATLGAAGAAAGAIVGGLTGGRTGAIIGGAAGGAGTVMATRGDQLEYPAESRLSFRLSQNIQIPAGRPIS